MKNNIYNTWLKKSKKVFKLKKLLVTSSYGKYNTVFYALPCVSKKENKTHSYFLVDFNVNAVRYHARIEILNSVVIQFNLSAWWYHRRGNFGFVQFPGWRPISHRLNPVAALHVILNINLIKKNLI